MSSEKKFSLLRTVLRALGLSQDTTTDIVNWIADLLAGGGETEDIHLPEFPYQQRDHFLSPAELNFMEALREVFTDQVTLCCKVGLDDLFWVKTEDQSRYRIYTNKIDRKHVDFLLCDAATMRPLMGIELDDKSHQRPDRRARDEFVDGVFHAAGLPLLHVPVRRAYPASELAAMLKSCMSSKAEPAKVGTTPIKTRSSAASQAPRCPKCGSDMVLRTAKNGANAGNRFWGCPNYPTCRSILPYEG